MSYLGKISAIVSANTSDFQSKLSGAAKDVQRFASSMQSSLTSAQSKATTSLRGIYTEAQKLERALQAAASRKLSFSGFSAENLQQAADRMRALYSATKEINQPLAEAAGNLGKLSAEVQASFLPAMVSAQSAAERLADTINRTGTASQSEFDAIAKKVNLVTSAVRRLQEASGMVASLNRGDSLRFSSPRTFDAFSSAQRAQQATSSLPASVVSRFGIGEQQAAVASQADRVLALQSRRDRRISLGLPTARVGAQLEAETDRLEAQIRVLERRNEAAQKFALIMKGGFVSADDLMKSSKGMDKGAFMSADSLAQQAASVRRDVLTRLENSGGFVSADDLIKSSKGMDRGKFVLAADLEQQAASVRKDVLTRLENSGNFVSADDLIKSSGKIDKGTFQPLGDLQKSAADLRSMTDEMRKLRAAADFSGSVGEAFEASKINRAKAEITALRNILITVGATTGDAADAVDDLTAGWQRAASELGGATKYAAQLKQLMDEAAEKVQEAVTAGGSNINVSGTLKNVGDISRMGADKAQLAFQQLAFAIDDFMSSTGGMEFKLRAVSNNISQMAFVLGGTKGLFIGLGVIMAGQLALGFTKFINNGRTSEDQAKALNDALARQKSLVEELAQAFRSFGDTLGRSMFSKAAQEAKTFSKEIDTIKEKQKARREAAIADIDPAVQEERATQGALTKSLESETNIGRRISIQQRIRESQERERIAMREAISRPAPTGREAADAINRGGNREFERFTRGQEVVTQRDIDILEEARRRAGAATGANSPQEIKDALIAQRDAMIARGGGDGDSRVSDSIRELDALIKGLEAPIKAANDALAIRVLEGSVKVAKSLERTQSLLDEAIIPFSDVRQQADAAAKELESVVKQLESAKSPERIRQLQAQRDAIEQQSRAYESAATTIRQFADVVKRISQDLVDAVAGEARNEADRARREANSAQGRADVGGEFGPNGERRRPGDAEREAQRTGERRRQLEADARRAEDDRDRVTRQNEVSRKLFEDDARGGRLGEDTRKLIEQRDRDLAIARDENATAADRMAAQQRAGRANRQLEQQYEDSPAGRAATARADRADREAQARRDMVRQEEARQNAADRGRELAMTPAQKAAEEAANGLKDIGEAFKDPLRRGAINQEGRDAMNRFATEQARSAAPAIFNMADEVANAVLQGPSRQALQVSDISTTQGRQELDRLLRGDDSAKNANVVELEKQNQKLTELVTTMKDVAAKMGVVLDL